MGAIALQARRAGPTAVAGVLVHFHAVHASEAGVGAAVGTLFMEAWGVGLDTVKATQRSPFCSPEVEAKAPGWGVGEHTDAMWSPPLLSHSPHT